jgi:hypothetical protein
MNPTIITTILGIVGAWAGYFADPVKVPLAAAIAATVTGIIVIIKTLSDVKATEAIVVATLAAGRPDMLPTSSAGNRVRAILTKASLGALALVLVACTTANPQSAQPATVRSQAETGQGGTDAAAGQLFGYAVTRPTDTKTPLAVWTFPSSGSEISRPSMTLHRRYDSAGRVTEEFYDPHLDRDGNPIMETVAGGLFIDARGSSFSNSVTPQGAVTGSGTTQSGTASPTSTQSATQTTSVPVTANVPVTLPNGTTIPAGGVIPAGTPMSVFRPGAILTPVR